MMEMMFIGFARQYRPGWHLMMFLTAYLLHNDNDLYIIYLSKEMVLLSLRCLVLYMYV